MNHRRLDEIVHDVVTALKENMSKHSSQEDTKKKIHEIISTAYHKVAPADRDKLFQALSLQIHPDKQKWLNDSPIWKNEPQAVSSAIHDELKKSKASIRLQPFMQQAEPTTNPSEHSALRFLNQLMKTQQRYPQPIKFISYIILAAIFSILMVSLVIIIAPILLISLMAAHTPILGMLKLLSRGNLDETIAVLDQTNPDFTATRMSGQALYSVINDGMPGQTTIQRSRSILKRTFLTITAIPKMALITAANLEVWLVYKIVPYVPSVSLIISGIIVSLGIGTMMILNIPLFIFDYFHRDTRPAARRSPAPEPSQNVNVKVTAPDVAFHQPPVTRRPSKQKDRSELTDRNQAPCVAPS